MKTAIIRCLENPASPENNPNIKWSDDPLFSQYCESIHKLVRDHNGKCSHRGEELHISFFERDDYNMFLMDLVSLQNKLNYISINVKDEKKYVLSLHSCTCRHSLDEIRTKAQSLGGYNIGSTFIFSKKLKAAEFYKWLKP